jgi:hypothetical protein
VGAEGFADLSAVDPSAEHLLAEAIHKDGSDQWYSGEASGSQSQK